MGKSHPTVRRLRGLRRDRRQAEQESVFVAEGIHLAQEALTSGADVELFAIAPEISEGDEGRALLERIESSGTPVVRISRRTLESVQDARSPQPVLTVARRRARSLETTLVPGEDSPMIVVACGIQDPGNLGSLLRSADAAGAAAFVVTGEAADLFHPRTVRASMGSIFRLPALAAETVPILDRLNVLKIPGVATTAGEGVCYDAFDFRRPCAIFFGGEGAGLLPAIRERIEGTLRIPMRRGVDSLSVGAAAAVVLFEAARQRRAG